MADKVEEAKAAVKHFWAMMNSGDTDGMKNSGFAPSYTFQGQPLTGEGTAAWMGAWFDTLGWYHFYILDLIGEQQGDEVKIVIRTLFQASRKTDGQKFAGMGVNVVTIGEDGIRTNWQRGATSLADCDEVDFFTRPEGAVELEAP